MSNKKEQSIYGRFETLNYWQRERLPALGVSPTARHVWHVLWGRADEKGVVVMSYGQISHEVGRTKRCCMKDISELIEKDIIQLRERGNSKNMANTYALRLKKKGAKVVNCIH